MYRNLSRLVPMESAAHVVLHAFWAKSRGRGLSMRYKDELNPRKAFGLAIADLYWDDLVIIPLSLPTTWKEICMLCHFLQLDFAEWRHIREMFSGDVEIARASWWGSWFEKGENLHQRRNMRTPHQICLCNSRRRQK